MAQALPALRDGRGLAHYIESAYDGAELPSSVVKLERGDEGYDEAVYAYIDTFVETEFLPYVPYYCLHIGAVYALVAFLLASALNGNTSCALDACSRARAAWAARVRPCGCPL